MPPVSDEDTTDRDVAGSGAGPTGLQALNAGAIVVAALYFGRDLLVPLVLAVLLAFVLAPLVVLLQRTRMGKAPSVLVAVALAFAAILGIGAIVGRQAATLAESLPAYQATMQDKVKSLTVGTEVIGRIGGAVQSMLTGALPGEPASLPPAVESPARDAAPSTLGVVRTVVAPLFGPLATLGVVVVFTVFVLLSREDLRDRVVRLVGRQDLHRTILAMNDAAGRLSRYFLFQLALNTAFGVFIAAGLWGAGLPNPVLWGILAALMRFVPYIGSVIAIVPPLLLALAVAPGWSLAVMVLGLFLLGDLLMGQVVEPLLYGHSTGLSPIAVVLSAAFWTFMWGPVGLLIATPLTVCLVVVGKYVQPLAFLEVMLGDGPPLSPAETFYQRALEGNAAELALQARRMVGDGSPAEYYDRVALRGLALAQSDLSRDALAFERLEAIHGQVATLLSGLSVAGAQHVPGQAPPPEWQADGAVVCIPARGQLDDLAAAMARHVLRDAGFGARQDTNLVLGAGQADPAQFAHARLCCLSVLDQGSSASGIRYLLKRIQRQMPGAAVVVCLWHADGGSPLLAALRSEGNEETIVLSLGELVALVRAVSARQPATVPGDGNAAAGVA